MEEITKKLIKIQKDLKAPKDLWNDFSKYHFRSAESIEEAVKPLCHAEGLALICTDEPKQVGDWNYIISTAKVTDGTNEVAVTAAAREQETKKGMDQAQITGAASSYARKYALCGLFAIDDGKDSDSHDNRKEGVKTSPKGIAPTHNTSTTMTSGSGASKTAQQVKDRLAIEKQIKLIFDKLKDIGCETKDSALGYLATEYGISDITKITLEDASILIEELIGAESDD